MTRPMHLFTIELYVPAEYAEEVDAALNDGAVGSLLVETAAQAAEFVDLPTDGFSARLIYRSIRDPGWDPLRALPLDTGQADRRG